MLACLQFFLLPLVKIDSQVCPLVDFHFVSSSKVLPCFPEHVCSNAMYLPLIVLSIVTLSPFLPPLMTILSSAVAPERDVGADMAAAKPSRPKRPTATMAVKRRGLCEDKIASIV